MQEGGQKNHAKEQQPSTRGAEKAKGDYSSGEGRGDNVGQSHEVDNAAGQHKSKIRVGQRNWASPNKSSARSTTTAGNQ